MKKHLTLVLSVLMPLVFFTQCTKEEADFRLPDLNIPVIYGYDVINPVGEYMGSIGKPRIKRGNESNDYSSEYFFTFFPNPDPGLFSVHTKTPEDGEVRKLWITPALYYGETPKGIPEISNLNTLFAGGAPVFQKEFTDVNIFLDLTSFPEGYYRVYLKVGEHLLYDNLVIYKEPFPLFY